MITTLVGVASAQVPLLNRVGTTIYPWRAGDKFSDSLLSANAALLNKNNVFTGAVNTFNAITLSTALDTAYSNSVSNVKAYTPLSIATSGKTKFISADTATVNTGLTTLYQNSLKLNTSAVGSMAYADSVKYHGSTSINTVGVLASGSIASGFGSINIGSNTINSGVITATGTSVMQILNVGQGQNTTLYPLIVKNFAGTTVASIDTSGVLKVNAKTGTSIFKNGNGTDLIQIDHSGAGNAGTVSFFGAGIFLWGGAKLQSVNSDLFLNSSATTTAVKLINGNNNTVLIADQHVGNPRVTIGTTTGIGLGKVYAGDSLYVGTTLIIDANSNIPAFTSFTGANSGMATIGGSDSVQVTLTGITANAVIAASYQSNSAMGSTIFPVAVGNIQTNKFTIFGSSGKNVTYWIAKK